MQRLTGDSARTRGAFCYSGHPNAQLRAARVDVELETTPRLRELRHVEVHVDGVLPLDVLRLRSLAHDSETTAGQFEITLGTFRCCSMALNAATSPAITRSNSVFT